MSCGEVGKMNLNEYRFTPGSFGPGPAAYRIPTTVGWDYKYDPKNPRPQRIEKHCKQHMYTFGQRFWTKENITVGPGPAQGETPKFPSANHHGKATSLQYSMGGRHTLIEHQDRKPSPADCQPDSHKYKPEEYERIMRSQSLGSPKFSFGRRFPIKEELSRGPAPNAYFPKVKSGAPAYSLTSRYAERMQGNASPGAGAYHPYRKLDGNKYVDRIDPSRTEAPHFTIVGARPSPLDKRISPGPAGYNLSHYTGRRKAPAWSLSSRTNRAPMIVEKDLC